MVSRGHEGVCLWSETLSPLNWSVILSPYEGQSYVEPQGAEQSQGAHAGERKEVHNERSSLTAGTVRASPATAEGSMPRGGARGLRRRPARTGPAQPPAPGGAAAAGRHNASGGRQPARLAGRPRPSLNS